jgi:type IV pilus assembly protein PilV
MRSRFANTHHPINGFTLIELLVAVAVFVIGILGVATMQGNSLRMNQQATMRWEASMLAYEMSDRLIANPIGAIAGDYSGDPSSTPINCVGVDVACTAASMAEYDKSIWLSRVGALPGGTGTITDGGGGAFTITVRWDARRTGATDTNCPPTSDDDLRCVEVEVAL